jgi:hypothetical protein
MFILPAKTDVNAIAGKYYVVDEVRKEDSSYERTLAPKGWSSSHAPPRKRTYEAVRSTSVVRYLRQTVGCVLCESFP